MVRFGGKRSCPPGMSPKSKIRTDTSAMLASRAPRAFSRSSSDRRLPGVLTTAATILEHRSSRSKTWLPSVDSSVRKTRLPTSLCAKSRSCTRSVQLSATNTETMSVNVRYPYVVAGTLFVRSHGPYRLVGASNRMQGGQTCNATPHRVQRRTVEDGPTHAGTFAAHLARRIERYP
jgi:hypothetical protein